MINVNENLDHRAALWLSEEAILRMFHLPAGTRVLRIASELDPPGIRVIITHPDLPEVEPFSVAPTYMLPQINARRVEVEEDGSFHIYERVIIDWDFLNAERD